MGFKSFGYVKMTWLCTDKHITVISRCLEPSFEDIELAKNLKNKYSWYRSIFS